MYYNTVGFNHNTVLSLTSLFCILWDYKLLLLINVRMSKLLIY